MSEYRQLVEAKRKEMKEKEEEISRIPVSFLASNAIIESVFYGYAFPVKGYAKNVSVIVEGLESKAKDIELVLILHQIRNNTSLRKTIKMHPGFNDLGTFEVSPGDRLEIGSTSELEDPGFIASAWINFMYEASGLQA